MSKHNTTGSLSSKKGWCWNGAARPRVNNKLFIGDYYDEEFDNRAEEILEDDYKWSKMGYDSAEQINDWVLRDAKKHKRKHRADKGLSTEDDDDVGMGRKRSSDWPYPSYTANYVLDGLEDQYDRPTIASVVDEAFLTKEEEDADGDLECVDRGEDAVGQRTSAKAKKQKRHEKKKRTARCQRLKEKFDELNVVGGDPNKRFLGSLDEWTSNMEGVESLMVRAESSREFMTPSASTAFTAGGDEGTTTTAQQQQQPLPTTNAESSVSTSFLETLPEDIWSIITRYLPPLDAFRFAGTAQWCRHQMEHHGAFLHLTVAGFVVLDNFKPGKATIHFSTSIKMFRCRPVPSVVQYTGVSDQMTFPWSPYLSLRHQMCSHLAVRASQLSQHLKAEVSDQLRTLWDPFQVQNTGYTTTGWIQVQVDTLQPKLMGMMTYLEEVGRVTAAQIWCKLFEILTIQHMELLDECEAERQQEQPHQALQQRAATVGVGSLFAEIMANHAAGMPNIACDLLEKGRPTTTSAATLADSQQAKQGNKASGRLPPVAAPTFDDIERFLRSCAMSFTDQQSTSGHRPEQAITRMWPNTKERFDQFISNVRLQSLDSDADKEHNVCSEGLSMDIIGAFMSPAPRDEEDDASDESPQLFRRALISAVKPRDYNDHDTSQTTTNPGTGPVEGRRRRWRSQFEFDVVEKDDATVSFDPLNRHNRSVAAYHHRLQQSMEDTLERVYCPKLK